MSFDKESVRLHLVSEISCGNKELFDALSDVFDYIWRAECAEGCKNELKYRIVKRCLISNAQKFVADRVDESHRRANNKAQDDFASKSWRDSSSRRESAGNRCSWTQATSFQQFQDDRAARQRDDSIAWSESVGTFWDTLSDRSTRDACGWTRASAGSKSKSRGFGKSKSVGHTVRKSRSGATTGEMIGAGSVDPPTGDIGSFKGMLVVGGNINASNVFPGFTLNGRSGPECGIDENGNPTCNPLPNYQRAYNGTISGSFTAAFKIPIPVLDIFSVSLSGSLDLTYARGERQTHVCSWGASCVAGASETESQSFEKSESDQHDKSNISDFTSDQHDVHRAGETHRSSEAHLGSLSQGVMRAHGERHTGNDASGHAQAQSAGEAESQMKHHAESRETGFSDSDFAAISEYWNQLSKALAELWARVNQEIEDLKRRLAASMMPVTVSYCDVDHMRQLAPDKNLYDRQKAFFLRGIPKKSPWGC